MGNTIQKGALNLSLIFLKIEKEERPWVVQCKEEVASMLSKLDVGKRWRHINLGGKTIGFSYSVGKE